MLRLLKYVYIVENICVMRKSHKICEHFRCVVCRACAKQNEWQLDDVWRSEKFRNNYMSSHQAINIKICVNSRRVHGVDKTITIIMVIYNRNNHHTESEAVYVIGVVFDNFELNHFCCAFHYSAYAKNTTQWTRGKNCSTRRTESK